MSKMASETWPEFMKARSSAAWRILFERS